MGVSLRVTRFRKSATQSLAFLPVHQARGQFRFQDGSKVAVQGGRYRHDITERNRASLLGTFVEVSLKT